MIAAEAFRSIRAIVLLAALLSASAPRTVAQPCPGDCNGDGGVERLTGNRGT